MWPHTNRRRPRRCRSRPSCCRSRTRPPVPTATVTRLGMVWPGTKLRFDAKGRGAPVGQTASHPGAVGAVAVTLRTTASTPLAGMPATFVTARSRLWPVPSLATRPPRPVPSRVSRSRVGTTGVSSPAAPESCGGNTTDGGGPVGAPSAKTTDVHTVPSALVAIPTPTVVNEGLRMLARWPDEFIQACSIWSAV